MSTNKLVSSLLTIILLYLCIWNIPKFINLVTENSLDNQDFVKRKLYLFMSFFVVILAILFQAIFFSSCSEKNTLFDASVITLALLIGTFLPMDDIISVKELTLKIDVTDINKLELLIVLSVDVIFIF